MINEIKVTDICQIEEIEKSFPQLSMENSVKEDYFSNPFTHIFTIIDKEKLIGILILDIIYDRMELVQIIVREEERNKKYASKLMEYMINLAKEKSLQNITLEVRCDNHPAIHLYEKYGFVSVAKRKNYYQNVDGILMERRMM